MKFENSFGELVDVVIENGSFSFNKSSKKTISDCTKVGEFLAQDVFDILMNEKPGLKDYDTLPQQRVLRTSIKVIRIIESFWRFDEKGSIPEKVKYHQVHISCTYEGIGVIGSEMIEDLPQKLREIKLEKILND